MKLDCTNFNGEIVLAKKLNHVELFFLIVKIAFINESYKLFFPGRCSKCPKNKIVHNILITNTNGMNQSFPHRQKYNLLEKKFKKRNSNFCNFFVALSLVLSLFGHNFCYRATFEKIIIFP